MKFLILLIINFFVFLKCDVNSKSNIKCFEGDGLSQRNWDKKDCETAKWCIKLADDDNSNEYRTCDEGNICQQIGNKCDSDKPNVVIEHHPTQFPVDKICCCNSDYCNSALSQITSVKTLLLPVLFVFLKYVY